MNKDLKVSITTVCLNSEKTIERTINSVIDQTYSNIEYIIIDGGSTDKTLDIIKKYEDRIAKWISESDNGIYDAMNKGIANSTGDILYFLNSDDNLYNNRIIEKIVDKFSDRSIVGVYGKIEIINDNKKTVRGCKVKYNNLLYRCIYHPALFVRRSLLNELGPFSTALKISADYEFIVKSIKKYPDDFLYIDEIIAVYRYGGMSCKMMEKAKIEDLKILSSNYNMVQFLFGAAVCAYVILRHKIQRILQMKSAHINRENSQ